MKRNLPLASLSLAAMFVTSALQAQADRTAYAITDVTKEGVQWSTLRRIDLSTGTYSDVLFNGNDGSINHYDAATKKQMAQPATHARFGTLVNAPFVNGVAAAAYDKRHDRLYFTPMFIDQLRYLDLKSNKVFFVNGPKLTGSDTKASDQSDILTRMVIASDGEGYALSNDGKQLIRFGTGRKATIANLGTLVDDPANKEVSIHNSCTSYGGDMIADDEGNLYIFSARNHVFRVNIETKVATHIGKLNGLPATFTVNGVAVADDNTLILTSAVDNSGVFRVNLSQGSLTATALPAATPWRTSDLANSNLLKSRKITAPDLLSSATIDNGNVRLFPNPATGKQFNVQLMVEEGKYTIQVTDIVGRQAVEAPVSVKATGQTETIQLPATSTKGVYLVNVVDADRKTIFSKKILVQ